MIVYDVSPMLNDGTGVTEDWCNEWKGGADEWEEKKNRRRVKI